MGGFILINPPKFYSVMLRDLSSQSRKLKGCKSNFRRRSFPELKAMHTVTGRVLRTHSRLLRVWCAEGMDRVCRGKRKRDGTDEEQKPLAVFLFCNSIRW